MTNKCKSCSGTGNMKKINDRNTKAIPIHILTPDNKEIDIQGIYYSDNNQLVGITDSKGQKLPHWNRMNKELVNVRLNNKEYEIPTKLPQNTTLIEAKLAPECV